MKGWNRIAASRVRPIKDRIEPREGEVMTSAGNPPLQVVIDEVGALSKLAASLADQMRAGSSSLIATSSRCSASGGAVLPMPIDPDGTKCRTVQRKCGMR